MIAAMDQVIRMHPFESFLYLSLIVTGANLMISVWMAD